MWPKERQAIYLQNLREHVKQSTPKVRRPRRFLRHLKRLAGDVLLGGLIIAALIAFFHQLFERG